MTSEIAVMNQRGVAFAADSAVTLVDGRTVVVRNDQRKLYNLVEGAPVAIMFFGVADMLGHPWEHLIEHYQKVTKKAASLAHLHDHADRFTAMLDRLEEFFPRERQMDDYRRLYASVMRHIFAYAQFLRDHGDEVLQASDDGQLVEIAIERVWRDYQFLDDGSPRGDLPCFPEKFADTIYPRHKALIEELIGYGFGQFALSAQSVQRLRDIAVFCVVKDLFLEDVSGLVFGGYGKDERFPSVVTHYVSAIVSGIVKRREMATDVIDTNIKSKIRVFADSEVTHAFLRGIDFGLERRLYSGFKLLLHGVVDQVIGSVDPIPEAQRAQLREKFHSDLVPQYFNAFRGMIGEYQQHTFINPVLRVLEIASKSELGDTARSLIELNIFKKRIMAQKETVGGAVDVAVLSRDGGFQWHSKGTGA